MQRPDAGHEQRFGDHRPAEHEGGRLDRHHAGGHDDQQQSQEETDHRSRASSARWRMRSCAWHIRSSRSA